MNYTEIAMEAYRLERDYGSSHEVALSAGIESVQNTIENDFYALTRDAIMAYAEALDNDESSPLIDDGPGALLTYAFSLDQALPPEKRKDGSGTRN